MLKYNNFILETKMTPEKESLIFELNDKGLKLKPFKYLDNKKYFYILKPINYDDYNPENNKVTLLYNTTYKDSDEYINRYKLNNLNLDNNLYLYYKILKTERLNREPGGISIDYNNNNDRFENHLIDNRIHYVVVRKNSNVSNIRMNYGQRMASGDKAEKIIANKFGFGIEQTKINTTIKRKNIVGEKSKSIIFDILNSDIDEYENLFEIDYKEPLNKYDLVITDGKLKGSKIEVKKYDIKSIIRFTNEKGIENPKRKGDSKPLEMAEQLKISNKSQLKKLVDLFSIKYPDYNVEPLIKNYNNDGGKELSDLFRLSYNGEYLNLINNIRNFYNSKIVYMGEKFNNIKQEFIMNEVFGVYFFNIETGVDGFLIKTKNKYNKRNMKYYWSTVMSHWGLKRIKLFFEVNPDSYRCVWLGDLKIFTETFKVGDIEKCKNLKTEDIRTKHNPILLNTEYGPIKWDTNHGYWIRVPHYYDIKSGVSI
jgi:hypothetical protein